MLDNLSLPKMFSLQDLVLLNLAKKIWGDLILRGSISDEMPKNITQQLVSHRKSVLNVFCQNLLPSLPQSFKDHFAEAVIWLQQGYSEASTWENRCETALPFSILNPITAGSYAAGHFINPAGQFNDLAWAKCFVADANQSLLYRFKFASYYCFEDKISELWHLIASCELRCRYRLTDYSAFQYKTQLDEMWSFHLENANEELTENEFQYTGDFYACGLREAVDTGHMYAASFFWEHCSAAEKDRFFAEFSFRSLTRASLNDGAAVINFIYSLLPEEKKRHFINWTSSEPEANLVWDCLLKSRFCEFVIDDILTFVYQDSFKSLQSFFKMVLFLTADLIVMQQVPVHKKIFKALWNCLPNERKINILAAKDNILSELASVKALDLLETIILPCSHREKNRMLLDEWLEAGVAPFHRLWNMGEHDLSIRYLLFFFIHQDSITKQQTIRIDAMTLLSRFIKSFSCSLFYQMVFTESERNEFNKLMDVLRHKLEVLSEVMGQTCIVKVYEELSEYDKCAYAIYLSAL